MTEPVLGYCRLCNYSSDCRLMQKISGENSSYDEKIEDYLGLKLFPDDKSFICFHCSQTLDNFHNFASKIQQIQKILYPEQQEQEEGQEIAYEICVIPESEDSGARNDATRKTAYKVLTVTTRTRSMNENSEKVFEEIRDCQRDDECSNRSYTLKEENVRQDGATDTEEVFHRDPDDNEWPNSENLKKLPSKVIVNGQLMYRGKELMKFMNIFYNCNCEMCPKNFNEINELFKHQKEAHELEPYISCCSIKLQSLSRIIWHFAKHVQPEAFRCKICSYCVSRPKFLEIHMSTHSNDKRFTCDICGKRFIWKAALKSHLANHRPDSERRNFECTICSKKYQTSSGLATHRKLVHSGAPAKPRNLCEICSKSFATPTSYKEHMISHSEDSEKLQLQCKECGKWLKNQRCLRSHLILHSKKTFSCSHCDYTTKKEKLLKNHLVTRHSSDRPFTCDQCSKSFKVKRQLTIHKLQSHSQKTTGRVCEFCSREFASSTNYYTHRKNLHAAELQLIIHKKKEQENLKRIELGLESSVV